MDNVSKRSKSIPNYRINLHAIAPAHPLGVKPSGNVYLHDDLQELEKSRRRLLGSLSILSEETLVYLIASISSPSDLLSLGLSSRILYAYTYSEEIWRKLYIDEFTRLEDDKSKADNTDPQPYGCQEWKGSWRRSLLKLDKEALLQSNNLIFSDILYRPYQCSQVNYEHLFKRVIALEDSSRSLGYSLNTEFGVERIDEASFVLEKFYDSHMEKPFILCNPSNPDRWPHWDLDSLLVRFGETKFRQEAVKWNLSFYAEYYKNNSDESPLYLFDCNSQAIKTLRNEYATPEIFKNDLFKLFQEKDVHCRPDHRWLIVGPAGSGSTFHKDPNQTSAWNAGLTGKKLWIMLPPGVKPPGVSTDKDEEEVTSPVGVAEWILSGYYNDAVKMAQEGKCFITVTFPGECIYVPSGWWHTVINLTDSVALTENFVPEPILPKILLFFKTKKRQLSGFHLRDTVRAMQHFVESRLPSSSISSSNFEVIKQFLAEFQDKALDNDDCGLSDLNLELPIFEFFVELVRDSDYGVHLEKALDAMHDLEAKAAQEELRKNGPSIKASEAWHALAAESESAFSFGFHFGEAGA